MKARRYIVPFVLVAVLAAFIIAMCAIQRVDNRATWATKTQAQLWALYAAVVTARNDFDDSPHHVLALFWLNYLSPEDFITHLSDTPLSEACPGDKSISQLHALQWPDLVVYARPILEASGEWQRVGDFFVSTSKWSLSPSDQPAVVALSTRCRFDSDLRAVLYSDGRRELVERDSWITSENQSRTKAGLAPLPLQP